MLKPPGILIAFEGVDGAGKTTQVALAARSFRQAGFSVVTTKEPTDGHWGTRLRESATTGRLSPEEELALFIRDRREHVDTFLRPALERGDIVLVDRYYFSTAAYQGARGADVESVLDQNETFAPQPDLLVLLDVAPEVGRARIRERGDVANLFESLDGLLAAAAIFRSIERPYLLLLDGHLPIHYLHSEVITYVREKLLFRRLCRKNNKQECEPAYCSFRVSDACNYTKLRLAPSSLENRTVRHDASHN